MAYCNPLIQSNYRDKERERKREREENREKEGELKKREGEIQKGSGQKRKEQESNHTCRLIIREREYIHTRTQTNRKQVIRKETAQAIHTSLEYQ